MDWQEKRWDSLSRDEILFRIAVTIIIASFATALFSTVIEAVSFNWQEMGKVALVTPKRVEKVELKPPIHPLRMLPSEVGEFTTVARHMMPGAEKYAAEAIYKPVSEDLSPAAPLNAYVRITYNSSKKFALDKIGQALKERYPQDRKTIEVNVQSAYSGYDANYGSYYLGWVWNQYSIEVDTAYTTDIPAEKGTVLADVAQQVARAVDAFISRQ